MRQSKAYKTDALLKSSLTSIDKYKLFFIEDIIPYLPCSRATFYNHGLDKLDAIKEALEKNRVEVKVALRSKWYNSDNPTLQLALMKIIGTEDEAARLNGSNQKHDLTSNGQTILVKLPDPE